LTEEKASESAKTKKEMLEAKADAVPAEIEAGDEAAAELQQLVKSAPPQVRHMMLSMMRLQGAGPFPHPIFEKFTSEHVGKFLDYSHEDEVNAYSLARSNRVYHLIYFFGVLGFLIFLFLTVGATDKSLLTEIIRMGVVIIGSFGGGYGWKALSDKRKSSR